MHLLAFTLFWLTDTSGNDQGDDCKEVKGTKKDRKLVMVKKKIIKKRRRNAQVVYLQLHYVILICILCIILHLMCLS